MSMKKSSRTGKGRGSKESYSMPGTAKAMESGNEKTESDHAMPGIGEVEEGRNDMPGDGMSSDRVEEGSGDMPEGGMSGGRDEEGGGMPGGGMNGGGSGGRDDDNEMPRSRTCGTMDVHRRFLSQDPSYARARDEIENLALRYANNSEAAQRPGVTRIPVVVHVVWNTPQQNISDGQINSQIDVLNRDFRRTNPDVNTTPAPSSAHCGCEDRVLPRQRRPWWRADDGYRPSTNDIGIIL